MYYISIHMYTPIIYIAYCNTIVHIHIQYYNVIKQREKSGSYVANAQNLWLHNKIYNS